MDYDHILNGRSSRQHHQDIIKQVQYERMAKDVESANPKPQNGSRIRMILMALINLITG